MATDRRFYGRSLMQYGSVSLVIGFVSWVAAGRSLEVFGGAITISMLLVLIYRYIRHMVSEESFQLDSPSKEFSPLILTFVPALAELLFLNPFIALGLAVYGFYVYRSVD